MLSGQPLKTAMRCGFSMAQIGEFAFIIASLGLSLGVISEFLYPVVVAVSVITTFLTPYMIRAAAPCYTFLEHHLPKRWLRRLNHMGTEHQASAAEQSLWRRLLKKMALNTLIYSILFPAFYPTSSAPLVGQWHMRRAHVDVYFALYACIGYEE